MISFASVQTVWSKHRKCINVGFSCKHHFITKFETITGRYSYTKYCLTKIRNRVKRPSDGLGDCRDAKILSNVSKIHRRRKIGYALVNRKRSKTCEKQKIGLNGYP